MDPKIQTRIQNWLDGAYDMKVKEEILYLQAQKPDELIDAFYRDLSFGTGGMRGIMGIGTNRMNIYTIRAATQGFANYLLQQPQDRPLRIFIGYDVRQHSRLFAQEAARVMAGNEIETFLTTDICPTPLASFGCRHYRCSGAIMITASHNPPQYNGFKVYWNDGAQVVPPHDLGIIAAVRRINDPSQVRMAELENPLIHWVGDEIDDAYLMLLDPLRGHFHKPHENSRASNLRLVYTNLHGTGLRLIPKALRRLGFDCVLVEPQASLDGSFPMAPSPNPEEEKALALGSAQLLSQNADLLLATDPDADRLGAVVREKEKTVRLNGNEIACLCLQHLASVLQSKGELPPNAAFIKTIVTTELGRKIANQYGIRCFDVLTGFKYIAELIRIWDQSFDACQFLFGAEESHGYLFGTSVRDKDGVMAACLLAQAADRAKEQNCTLIDRLYDLYRIHGVHRQSLTTLDFDDSPAGMDKIQTLMIRLRKSPPHTIHGKAIVQLDDYLERISLNIATKKQHPLSLAMSDVLHFHLEDHTKLVVRPSGTEPKIKIYAEVCAPPTSHIDASIAQCDQSLQELIDAFKKENNL